MWHVHISVFAHRGMWRCRSATPGFTALKVLKTHWEGKNRAIAMSPCFLNSKWPGPFYRWSLASEFSEQRRTSISLQSSSQLIKWQITAISWQQTACSCSIWLNVMKPGMRISVMTSLEAMLVWSKNAIIVTLLTFHFMKSTMECSDSTSDNCEAEMKV